MIHRLWVGILVAGVAIGFASGVARAVPFWGAKESLPAGTPPAALKPGQFVWMADEAPSGPIAVIVSLTEQRAYVYRNGIAIGVTSVSTGKPGHETPTGVFMILQKDKDHHSKKYNDAPMPYQERLTWDGVALHAGGLPGYPSSHGCVHLPSEFARRLFEISPMGMTVVVADQHSAPQDVVHPTLLAPIDAKSGADDEEAPLAPDRMERWEPDKSPSGPVSIVLGAADRRLIVLRNGVEIGRARIEISDPDQPVGTHAFIVVQGGGATPKWISIGVPGHESKDERPLDPLAAGRVSVPKQFRDEIGPLLTPGTTLVLTDGEILPEKSGAKLQVVNSDPPS